MNILLIGCGNMGKALLKGWPDYSVTVIDKNFSDKKSITEFVNINFDAVVLAVKPQQMDQVVYDCKNFIHKTLFISIAIGKSFSYFEKILGNVAIVRSMPNLSVCLKKGLIINCSNHFVTQEQKKIAYMLMNSLGHVIEVKDEKFISVAASISGGGPAYFSVITDYLIQSAIENGCSENEAAEMVLYTFIGTAALIEDYMQKEDNLINIPKKLSNRVASPGGSTREALNVLKTKNLNNVFHEAINSAIKHCLVLEKH